MKKSSNVQKWDAHHHLWTYASDTMAWIPNERIMRDFHLPEWELTLDQAGIDRSILVQVHQTWQETLDLQALANQSKRIAGVVGWIDLLAADLSLFWEQLPQTHQVVGFRHILQAEPPEFFAQTELIRGIQAVGRADFAYDVLVMQHQLPDVLPLAKDCESTRLIIDHLAKPNLGQTDRSAWEKPMKELAQMPHVAVKISGFTTECPGFHWQLVDFIPYFDFLLHHFGPDRLMIGSDWPVCLMAASYAEQKSIVETWIAPLSLTEKKAMWQKTAQTWYGL